MKRPLAMPLWQGAWACLAASIPIRRAWSEWQERRRARQICPPFDYQFPPVYTLEEILAGPSGAPP